MPVFLCPPKSKLDIFLPVWLHRQWLQPVFYDANTYREPGRQCRQMKKANVRWQKMVCLTVCKQKQTGAFLQQWQECAVSCPTWLVQACHTKQGILVQQTEGKHGYVKFRGDLSLRSSSCTQTRKRKTPSCFWPHLTNKIGVEAWKSGGSDMALTPRTAESTNPTVHLKPWPL